MFWFHVSRKTSKIKLIPKLMQAREENGYRPYLVPRSVGSVFPYVASPCLPDSTDTGRRAAQTYETHSPYFKRERRNAQARTSAVTTTQRAPGCAIAAVVSPPYNKYKSPARVHHPHDVQCHQQYNIQSSPPAQVILPAIIKEVIAPAKSRK